MSKIRVAVLMGGRSSEREVSLSTGRQVLAALDPAKYEAFPIDTADLRPALDGSNAAALIGRGRPDVAFVCLHGRYGEDGTIQGLLELLEIPYTGSGVLGSALAMNKWMSKRMYQSAGIPSPWGTLLRGSGEAQRFVEDVFTGANAADLPLVVKPNKQGSTLGVTIVRSAQQLLPAVQEALALDDEVLVESFIGGIEITGPALGNECPEALPLVEIVPEGGFYDYEAKYTQGATTEICPARLGSRLTEKAKQLAVQAHLALGCRGYSRTDMIVASESVWVLETNTIPGMTPTSLLPRAAEAAGISFRSLVDRMVELAREGTFSGPAEATAGVHALSFAEHLTHSPELAVVQTLDAACRP